MRHFTTLEVQQEIERDMLMRASKSQSDYDGAAALPNAPKSIYFELTPATESHLPFSFKSRWLKERFPSREMAALSLNSTLLFSEKYQLYLCAVIPSQFGPNWMTKVSITLGLVPPGHTLFADENFVRLDKLHNQIVTFLPHESTFFSTRSLLFYHYFCLILEDLCQWCALWAAYLS